MVGATLPLWIPAFAGMTNGGAGLTKGCREWRRDVANGEGMPRMAKGCRSGLSRIGVRDILSWQSRMPAGAGTRRYEDRVHWLVGEF